MSEHGNRLITEQELPPKKRTLQINLLTFLKRSDKKEYWGPQFAENYHDLQNVLKKVDTARVLKEESHPWKPEELPKKEGKAKGYYLISNDGLQSLARLRGMPNRSRMNRNTIIENLNLFEKPDPTSEEMQVLLGKHWALVSGSLVFLYKDKTIMCGRLATLTDFIQTRQIPDSFMLITQNSSPEELLRNVESRDSFYVIKLQDYFYKIEYLKEGVYSKIKYFFVE